MIGPVDFGGIGGTNILQSLMTHHSVENATMRDITPEVVAIKRDLRDIALVKVVVVTKKVGKGIVVPKMMVVFSVA
jgi:adenosyl cobinamide kinase/adenosyl cobinamide phosphate guanylyltransferase